MEGARVEGVAWVLHMGRPVEVGGRRGVVLLSPSAPERRSAGGRAACRSSG